MSEKDRNQILILRQLMDGRPVSATDMARKTNLSAATVCRVFRDLRDKELILFNGKVKTEKGRNPDLYCYNCEYGFLLHYYVTNKAIIGYLANLDGEVIEKAYIGYGENDTLDDFFTIIGAIRKKLSSAIRNRKGGILAAGFSIPGVVNQGNGTVYTIPDVYQLNNIKFFEYARRVLDMPIIANNISWLSAVGEKTRVYPYANSLVYLLFNNYYGVGAGIIYKNDLIRGGMHYAGEIGQTWFDRNYTFKDYAEGKGMLEHTASMKNIYDKAERAIKEGSAPILQKLRAESGDGCFSLNMLEKAALGGERTVIEILEGAADIWAGVVANLNFIINPEFIVLGGCLSVKNKYMLSLLSDRMNMLSLFQPNVQMSVTGEEAQLYGGLHELREYVNSRIIMKEAVR